MVEQTFVVACRVTAAQHKLLGDKPGDLMKRLIAKFTGQPGVTRGIGRPKGSKDRVKRKKRKGAGRERPRKRK